MASFLRALRRVRKVVHSCKRKILLRLPESDRRLEAEQLHSLSHSLSSPFRRFHFNSPLISNPGCASACRRASQLATIGPFKQNVVFKLITKHQRKRSQRKTFMRVTVFRVRHGDVTASRRPIAVEKRRQQRLAPRFE